jgi:hypothetical protein
MKKSKRRNSSLKSRRRRSQKVWKMRGCSSRRSMVCATCHCKCNRTGMCPMCGRKCSCGKSSRRGRGRRGGTADVPLAYSNDGNVPSVLNPHYAYPGIQKGGYVDIKSPLAPLNVDAIPQPPFVGAPWGAEVSQWPGVSAPHSGNHLAHNSYDVQPEMNPVSERSVYIPQAPILQQLGGRRRRNRKVRKLTKRRMRGGDFGVFSQLGTDLTNTYRAWNGDPALPSPLPYKDQMFYGRNAQDNLNYLKVG